MRKKRVEELTSTTLNISEYVLIFKSFLENLATRVCMMCQTGKPQKKNNFLCSLCVDLAHKKWHVLSFIFECDKHQPHDWYSSQPDAQARMNRAHIHTCISLPFMSKFNACLITKSRSGAKNKREVMFWSLNANWMLSSPHTQIYIFVIIILKFYFGYKWWWWCHHV